jgi:hypothetical protein
MSTQSLIEEIEHPDTTKIAYKGGPQIGIIPIEGKTKYMYVLKIRCLDKNEEEGMLRVSQKTQIRVTKKDKTRCVFYYDTIKMKDSIITGIKSKDLHLKIEPIKLSDVVKVEIQSRLVKAIIINPKKVNEPNAFMLNKQYDNAILKYNEASILFPQKSYPKIQIEKANSLKK